MSCEEIREELVAYCDGELPKEHRARIATHLSTCSACSREAKQFARVNTLFTQVERVTPSPDFAATFWQRLEQEKHLTPVQESRFARWWREWRESLTSWQLAPALAGAASIIIFFGYVLSDRGPTGPEPEINPPPGITSPPPGITSPPVNSFPPIPPTPDVPVLVQEKLGLFVDYHVIGNLERFLHFDTIAAVELPEDPPIGIAENDIPKDVLEKPGFFANYPMLRKMEELKNLETVLDTPLDGDEKSRG